MCNRLSSIAYVPGCLQTNDRTGATEHRSKLLGRARRLLSLGRLWIRRPWQLFHLIFLLILILIIHIILVIIVVVILWGGGSACRSPQHTSIKNGACPNPGQACATIGSAHTPGLQPKFRSPCLMGSPKSHVTDFVA